MNHRNSLGKRFRDWLQNAWITYATFACTVWFFDHLPRSVARPTGRGIGLMGYWVDRGNVRRARENLARAFPQQTPAERERILKECYKHLGQCMADVCRFRSITAEELKRDWIVRDPVSEESLRVAQSQNKGVIAVSAHIGFWELIGFAFPSMTGTGLVSVSNRLVARRVNNLVQEIRQRLGNVVVHQEGALVALLRALKEKKAIGVIMDHWGGNASPLVPFFGTPTRTIDTCVRLHLKTGAPMALNLMIREADGRYRWHCRPVVPPARGDMDETAYSVAILREINRMFEEVIQSVPSQWFWMHRRWR